MHIGQSIVVLVAFMAMSVSCVPVTKSGSGDAGPEENAAVLGSPEFLGGAATAADTSKLLKGVVSGDETDDLDEDPNDPFITTRKGKLRPNLVSSEDEWAEKPIARPLHRVKRCGGGGGGGDDGDAERARRARRARRNRARRARRARKAAARRANDDAVTTTTVRKVLQDGQVISQSVIPQASYTQQQPMVQAVAPQPVLVQHQPAQQVAQPQVVAAPQPQVVAAPQPQVAGVPSISVQGSVKVN